MGTLLNIIKGFFRTMYESYFMINVCVRLLLSVLLLSTMFSNAQDIDMIRFRIVFILFFIIFMYWSFYPMIEKFVNINEVKKSDIK